MCAEEKNALRDRVENVRLCDEKQCVVILDQTKLPNAAEWIELKTAEEFYEAIYALRVRGAPAIGICAGFALYVLASRFGAGSKEAFFERLSERKRYLASSRPTAVNLVHALDRVERAALSEKDAGIPEILAKMRSESLAIQDEDMEMCRAISEYGLTLVRDGDGILTHCNAGPLATSVYGTGLGALILGAERGLRFHAYVDETRPLLQGARLTAYELDRAGIDVTLICDNMAALVMRQGKVNACFVGCDRVAANGDTANKIGTSGAAVLARYYGIPFYVFCPSSTVDFGCKTGADIVIEERDPSEIRERFFSAPVAPEHIRCFNPAFDVTEAKLITAIVTEKGICRYPYDRSLAERLGAISIKHGKEM